MNLKGKLFQKKNLWHVGAIALFLTISLFYFHPALTGYVLKQADVTNWSGAAQEIVDYRAQGDETLWTNSMFSGMPSVQISTIYEGLGIIDFFRSALTLWLPVPISYLFLYFLGFYLLSIALKIKPYIGIIGAIAYGLSSYFIIILEAGHNTKALAIGFAPLVIAGFLWAFRSKRWLLSVAVAGLFMALELRANHLQITYYLAFILIAIGITELISAIKNKTVPNFIKRTVSLLVVYGLAIGINYGNIRGTLDYTEHTTRGGSELTINADGTPKEVLQNNDSGLDIDYITNWSYGISESFSLIIPNFKGGVTKRISDNESSKTYLSGVNSRFRNDVAQNVQYYGDQPFVSGPVYIGIIVVFLAILALYYIDDNLKWGLLVVTILTLMLSWGKNFLGLTQFFVDYLPGYNKFRAVTIILFVVELTLPLLAVLFLSKLVKNKEVIQNNIKPFYIISGVFGVILLGFLMMPETFNSFTSARENDQIASNTDPNAVAYFDAIFPELIKARVAIFRADVLRSLVFLVLGAALVWAFVKNYINKYLLGGLLLLFIFVDLYSVDNRYISTKTKGSNANWIEAWKQKYPFTANAAELEIIAKEKTDPQVADYIDSVSLATKNDLKSRKIRGGEANKMIEHSVFRALNRASNFRVMDQNNPFNSARASYFGKSIGGYHGAKLGIYQELIEFHLSTYNQAVLNMLNTKYLISPQGDQLIPNINALGNAWFVKSIKSVENADESIQSLAVVNNYQATTFNGNTINNGLKTDSLLTVDPSQALQLIDATGKATVLEQIPFQATNQQQIAYVANGQNGAQWTYYESSLPKDSVLLTIGAAPVGFSPENEAIVINANTKASSFSGEGTIQLDKYHPDHLKYTSNSASDQFAVFSEIYYTAGWKAYIDNNEVPIIRANYVLRGLEVPAGTHQIDFKFELESYKTSGAISLYISIFFLLLLAAGLYLEVLKPKNNLES